MQLNKSELWSWQCNPSYPCSRHFMGRAGRCTAFARASHPAGYPLSPQQCKRGIDRNCFHFRCLLCLHRKSSNIHWQRLSWWILPVQRLCEISQAISMDVIVAPEDGTPFLRGLCLRLVWLVNDPVCTGSTIPTPFPQPRLQNHFCYLKRFVSKRFLSHDFLQFAFWLILMFDLIFVAFV